MLYMSVLCVRAAVVGWGRMGAGGAHLLAGCGWGPGVVKAKWVCPVGWCVWAVGTCVMW